MPRRLWIAALTVWPGLPQIWSGQEVLGLLWAALFAASVNVYLVCRWIWTDTFPPGLLAFFAALGIGCWVSSFGYTVWWISFCHPEGHRPEIDRLFREAMESYLAGRYQESRRHLERIVAMDESDADALMQLGTLFVRTEQPALARRAFRQCLDLEGGSKWRWEIQQALTRVGGVPAYRD